MVRSHPRLQPPSSLRLPEPRHYAPSSKLVRLRTSQPLIPQKRCRPLDWVRSSWRELWGQGNGEDAWTDEGRVKSRQPTALQSEPCLKIVARGVSRPSTFFNTSTLQGLAWPLKPTLEVSVKPKTQKKIIFFQSFSIINLKSINCRTIKFFWNRISKSLFATLSTWFNLNYTQV